MTKEVGWEGALNQVDGAFSFTLSWLMSAAFQKKLAQAVASN